MNFTKLLCQWYDKHKRILSFRATKDPYKIWLSEIILQQTRVEQGLPYYERFIEKFPDVFSLATANEGEVLKLWQGLGYYSRGRNMHKAAKQLINHWQGKFPNRVEDLLTLKGIGSYTAAAIASFAFNKAEAVVDGNVMRVLARVFAIDVPVNKPQGKKIITQLANEVLSRTEPAQHNYALMELGALICKPQNPRCDDCPVSAFCVAFMHKKQNLLPVKEKKTASRKRYLFYFVLQYKNSFYIKQRNENDIWKNLYDFPAIEAKTIQPAQKILKIGIGKLPLARTDYITVKSISKEYKHVLSHQDLYVHFIVIKLKNRLRLKKSTRLIAVTMAELKEFYAHSRLMENFIRDTF
jgi:A/G-specific adenine glycosylase